MPKTSISTSGTINYNSFDTNDFTQLIATDTYVEVATDTGIGKVGRLDVYINPSGTKNNLTFKITIDGEETEFNTGGTDTVGAVGSLLFNNPNYYTALINIPYSNDFKLEVKHNVGSDNQVTTYCEWAKKI